MKLIIVVSGVAAVLLLVIVLPDLFRGNIKDILLNYPGIDKPVHFIEFMLIPCMAYFFLSSRLSDMSRKKKVWISVIFALLISLIDEFHQLFISGRSFEYADLHVNAAGILTGTLIILYKTIRPIVVLPAIAITLLVVSLATFDSYRKTKHFNRGILYEREGNYQEAMNQYLLAVKSGSNNPALFNNMAWINSEFLNGDADLSFEYVKKAFALNPGDADIIETYGWILYKMNKPDEAIKYLKKAQAINPEIYCINYHLGASYFALGEYDLSLYYLKKQIEMNPENRYAIRSRKIIDQIKRKSI